MFAHAFPRCLEKVGWQRSNSTVDWAVEGSNLLGNSTLLHLNEPEYAEDPEETECSWEFDDADDPYFCDEGRTKTCTGGLYTDDTTQTESPCLRGWHFFNLQRDGEICSSKFIRNIFSFRYTVASPVDEAMRDAALETYRARCSVVESVTQQQLFYFAEIWLLGISLSLQDPRLGSAMSSGSVVRVYPKEATKVPNEPLSREKFNPSFARGRRWRIKRKRACLS